MYKVIGVCAAGWAAVCLLMMSQDAVTGAWLWIGSLVLAPVVLLMVSKPRRQPATLRALDVEAEVWCASAASVDRTPEAPPEIARATLDRLEAIALRTSSFAHGPGHEGALLARRDVGPFAEEATP